MNIEKLIIDQLKINHVSVKRFIVLESDFAINIIGKLFFYQSLLPKEVALLHLVHTNIAEEPSLYLKTELNL